MNIIKQVEFTDHTKKKVEFKIISEEQNFLCRSCMRVIKEKVFMLVLDDETNAVVYYCNSTPTQKDQYVCEECKQKQKNVGSLNVRNEEGEKND